MRRLMTACTLAVLLTGCGDASSPAARSSTAETIMPTTVTASRTSTGASLFQVEGTITIPGGINLDDTTGLCSGIDPYGDIRSEAQVVVTDASERTIALGELTYGKRDGEGATRHCVMHFLVDGVPRGEGFYGVEVADRGRVQFSEADMLRPIAMTLGS